MKKKLLLLLLTFVLVCSSSIVAFAEDTLAAPPEAQIPTATGAEALAAIADTEGSVVIDLRSAEDYAVGHIKGTVSLPVCLPESEGYAVTQTLKDNFVNYVKANPDMANKKIYLVCYVGTFCVNHAANWLVNDCEIAAGNLYRVEKGVWNDTDLAASLTCVTGDQALNVVGNEKYVILDVRATKRYDAGHIKGSVSLPLFTVNEKDENVAVKEPYTDELSTAFTKYVTDNKETLAGKDGIYILCNSGATGAVNATTLLAKAGITENVYTIEGGAKGLVGKLTYVSGDQALNVVGNEEYIILDVRAVERYNVGHLKGSVSLPLFTVNEKNENVAVKAPYEDALSQAFLKYAKDNKDALAAKKGIYILCNSGATGAVNATTLLAKEGITANVYTIENGAKGLAGKLTYVSAAQTLNVVGNDKYIIIDVRAAKRYEAGHLKGSVSLPLFTVDANDKNVPVKAPYEDALSQAFLKYVKENKEALAAKDGIYILCNSGATGAANASALLAQEGITANVYTIEGGATKNASIQAAFVKEAPKTGDMTPTMGYIVVMLAAAAVIMASKKKLAK